MAYKTYRLKKIIFVVLFLVFLLSAGFAFALEIKYPDFPGVQTPQEFIGHANQEDIPGLWVKYIIALATWASGILAVLSLIWGGIKFLISTGKPDKIIEARKQISGAFLGLAIILCSYFVLNIISPYFINFTLPDLKNFQAANIPSPPYGESQGSSVDVYIPFGRIIENIFQTYISNREEAKQTDQGPVVPETLTRIQRITNILDATMPLLPPIAGAITQIRDLAQDCDCWETNPFPRCSVTGGCSTCPTIPPLCTCDPCEKSRSKIVQTEKAVLPYLFGVADGLDGFSNLIGNVQLLGGIGELEQRIDSGNTAGIEDTIEGVDAVGGTISLKNMADSVGGLDQLENIVDGVDQIGGADQLEGIQNVLDGLGGMDQFSGLVDTMGGLNNLNKLLNVVEGIGGASDFGTLIDNIGKIGGIDGLQDLINKAGGIDDLGGASDALSELGGIDELKGITDKIENADNFSEILDVVKKVGGIDVFGDTITDVANMGGVDELENLLNKAGGVDNLEDVIDIIRTVGTTEEFKNMFAILDAIGGPDEIERIVNMAGSAESLADALNVIMYIGGMDVFKNKISSGDITGIEDAVKTTNNLGGTDELENIINKAEGIENLSDLANFMSQLGSIEEFKQIIQVVDALGGADGIENIINKAGSIDNLADALNLAKQAGDITTLKKIMQETDALGGLTELKNIINKVENIDDLSDLAKLAKNVGGTDELKKILDNIGGISQLQNTINAVNTAGGISQLSDMLNKVNLLGGTSQLTNIITSAGGIAELQNVVGAATSAGSLTQFSTIMNGVTALGGPTHFGSILDALGATSLGEMQGISGIVQHDAYGQAYQITTNLTTETSKLEKELSLLQNWFERLIRAQEFIESCDWVTLNNRNTFFQKKDEFEAKGWTIDSVAFYDDLGIVLNVPKNPATLRERWFPVPGTKLEEMADESTLYCAVGGSYVRQPSDFKLGLAPPDPFAGIGESELQDYLENEDLYTYQMACDVTIPFGEVLDKATRLARLLVNNLNLILDREKKIIEAAGKIQVLASQCSSRPTISTIASSAGCWPLCVCVPTGPDTPPICVEMGCFGSPCPSGEIGDTARPIEGYVKEIADAQTVVRKVFSQAPDLLQGMQDSLRNHMTKCAYEAEVGADVEFYTCDKAVGATDETGKIIAQCDPGTNSQWQDTPIYGNCLNKCMFSKISVTPDNKSTGLFQFTDYRKCVSDCMASYCIYNYNHEFNFQCCHYKL
jgi:hypothetical protein